MYPGIVDPMQRGYILYMIAGTIVSDSRRYVHVAIYQQACRFSEQFDKQAGLGRPHLSFN